MERWSATRRSILGSALQSLHQCLELNHHGDWDGPIVQSVALTQLRKWMFFPDEAPPDKVCVVPRHLVALIMDVLSVAPLGGEGSAEGTLRLSNSGWAANISHEMSLPS